MKPHAEEMVEEGHQRLHAHESLAVEGKDKQEQDGVGLEMKGLNPTVVEDGGEERGERRDKLGEDAMKEERIDRPGRGPLLRGAAPHQGLPTLVCLVHRRREHRDKVSILGNGGLRKRWQDGGGG